MMYDVDQGRRGERIRYVSLTSRPVGLVSEFRTYILGPSLLWPEVHVYRMNHKSHVFGSGVAHAIWELYCVPEGDMFVPLD